MGLCSLGRPLCAREEAHHPLLPTQVIGHSNFWDPPTTCVHAAEAMPSMAQGVGREFEGASLRQEAVFDSLPGLTCPFQGNGLP